MSWEFNCMAQKLKTANLLQRLLHVRGVHWLVNQFGGEVLRRLSFDEKFRSGDWNFTSESPGLVNLVEKYAAQGHILALGCGTAAILTTLKSHTFESFLGVDLSPEAILRARKHESERVRFEVGNMVKYECLQNYNVILFSDSLYYAPPKWRKRLLNRMRCSLAPQGRIIVAIAQPSRYAGILDLIRRNFQVELDRTLDGEERHVLVFY
jgi:trans-aconitate methyltransferase